MKKDDSPFSINSEDLESAMRSAEKEENKTSAKKSTNGKELNFYFYHEKNFVIEPRKIIEKKEAENDSNDEFSIGSLEDILSTDKKLDSVEKVRLITKRNDNIEGVELKNELFTIESLKILNQSQCKSSL